MPRVLKFEMTPKIILGLEENVIANMTTDQNWYIIVVKKAFSHAHENR